MTVYQMLARNARKYPAQLAISDDKQELHWAQLAEQVEQLAAWLEQHYGVRPGDRVALVIPNSIAFVVGFFAIQRLDAIAVPINVRLTTPELEYILGDAEAELVLTCKMTDAALKPLVEQGLAALWLDDLSVSVDAVADELQEPAADTSSPCILLYTSGTLVGAAHVVAPTFSPDLLLDLVPKHQVSHFFGAPVAYLLTAQQSAIKTTDLSSVSHWIYGGAAMSTEHTKLVQQAFRSDQFYCVYGLTEAGPSGTLLLPHEHATKAGSVGRRAAFNTEVRLRTETGTEPGMGEPGEVEIAGDGMMQCYWRNAGATAETFTADGWLKTGDIAVRDEDGFYWIKDRKKDIIIAGGVNIYPREIEDALSEHPAVLEAAVIGVPHKNWGESVKVFVVLQDKLDDAQHTLAEFLQQRLADYKLPRFYEIIDELPRNASGKVIKQQLR